MLFPTPPQFRKRRGRVRATDPLPPSGPLTVMSVIGLDDGVYRITFSASVTLVGGDVTAIEIGNADDDQWYPADGPVAAGANAIDVGIGSNGFTDWRILTQPVAITQPLAVPMSGVVV